MTAVNILELNINERSMGYAKIYSSLIDDEFQRKRAYASIVGLFALVDALEKTDNEIQKNMTLFRNAMLNEKYELADFYVNNWHIDVRIIGDGYNVIIPKRHFDNDIVPDFYAVVKLDKDITSAKLIGFIDTNNIDKQPLDYYYYYVPVDSLIPYEEFLLKVNKPKEINFDESEHEKFRSLYLSILDQGADIHEETNLLKHLFACPECRTEFCCFTGFEMVNSNLGKYPDLFEDKTLNIIGAQAVDEEQYAGKEEIIDISNKDNDEEDIENSETQQEEQAPDNSNDQTTSDILDELFSDEEEPIVEEQNDTPKVETAPDPILQSNDEPQNINLSNDETDVENLSELKLSDDEKIDLPSIDDDVLLTEYSTENDAPLQIDKSSDIQIISDNLSVESENSNSNNEKDDVQKVIVDYDEYGEPVYSYITNVPPEDDKKDDFEAEESDYDILNEEFETFNPQVNIDEDLSHIKNGGQRTIEYVQSEDTVEEIENNTNSEIEIIEEPTKDDSYDEIQEVEDYNTDNHQDNNQEIIYNDFHDEKEDYQDLKYNDNYEDNLENTDTNAEYLEYHDSDEETSEKSEDDDNQEYIEYEDENPQEKEEDESEYMKEEVNNQNIEQDEEQDEEQEFEEYEEYNDDYEMSDNNGASNKRKLGLLSIIIGIILISSVIGGMLFFKNSNSDNEAPQIVQNNDNIQSEQPQDSGIIDIPQNNSDNMEQNNPPQSQPAEPMLPSANSADGPQLTENNLLQPQNPNTADVNTAMTNAFSNRGTSLSLRNLNWLCTPQLFTDNQFKAYLQNLDNILKLNIRKNILNATDNPQNPNISVKMAIDNDGNLIKYVIENSSGSEQIDNIVLQSINETFEGEKSPILTNSPLKSDKYYLKVIIKL